MHTANRNMTVIAAALALMVLCSAASVSAVQEVQSDITLTTPNGGDVWRQGSSHDITRTSSSILVFAYC